MWLKVIVLAIVQGLAELLPVSSSAHVIVAEKLLGLDASSPPMTLLLVLLHTGTMLAVIAYFWRQWRGQYFGSARALGQFVLLLALATALTAAVAGVAVLAIGRTLLRGATHASIEDLFDHLELIAPALAAAGVLILVAGFAADGRTGARPSGCGRVSAWQALLIGAVQGLCLPFRGFSRSGATISTGMLAGVERRQCEAFSFALAVVLTPAVVARELLRLVHSQRMPGSEPLSASLLVSLFGAAVAFLAGLLALRWLSRWLERGRWYLFGIYCLAAAAAVTVLSASGY
jgi:undecaprenyl-diphosphatase